MAPHLLFATHLKLLEIGEATLGKIVKRREIILANLAGVNAEIQGIQGGGRGGKALYPSPKFLIETSDK
jgi:hypothetical protein